MDRRTELEGLVKYHQDLYYNAQPEISDADFDALWDELKALDPGNALFKKVGEDKTDGWPKAKHVMMMGSQSKAANEGEFADWLKKHPDSQFFVQHKLDGASIELQYEDGDLVRAVTRGNGEIGDDITPNALKMKGVKKTLPVMFSGAIRGEVLMTHEVHQKFFSDKANCRNAANGLMKRKDGVGVEHLVVVCYDVKGDAIIEFETETKKISWLGDMGFNVVNHTIIDRDKIIEYRKKVAGERKFIAFDIDGLVIKTIKTDEADLALPRPEKQIAFKFELDEAITTLEDVIWSESGAHYTPIAVVKPVQLCGTTVKRANLCNTNLLKGLGLMIGSQVVMTKRGEIIPKLERVVSTPDDARPIQVPSRCSCGTPLIDEGTFLYCPNEGCPKKRFHRVQKWIETLDILEFGTSLLTKLMNNGRVRRINDLYTLGVQDIAGLEGMGESSAAKVLKNLQAKTEVSLPKFIKGFDIEGIGESTAEKIEAAGFDTLEKMRDAPVDKLSSIPGIGSVTALQFHAGMITLFMDMDQLLQHSPIKIKQRITGGKLAGMSFCFTGALNTMKRPAAEALVKELGGAVKSVGKGLTYLVTNDPHSGSEKNRKAQELGIALITEEQFLDLAK